MAPEHRDVVGMADARANPSFHRTLRIKPRKTSEFTRQALNSEREDPSPNGDVEMPIHARALSVALILALCACAGTNFDWKDTERIKPGMTEAEVTAILGRPYSKTQSGNMTILTWSYATGFGGAKAVSYRLVNGKVAGSTTVNKQ